MVTSTMLQASPPKGISQKRLAKNAFMENFLYIVDKVPNLVLLKLNTAQTVLFNEWDHRMILCKSRQEGISTAILADFFTDALFIPGLVVAVISHEDYATRRLLDKIDIFHANLPLDIKPRMTHNSDYEKSFPNGSTIYIGTAGQRAFGRGDTIHRALVSEEAHYADAEKILSGLKEAVPMDGYLIRESTPLGDSGYFYSEVQSCIKGESDYKLVPFWWWYGDDYTIPRGSESVRVEDRGELLFTQEEASLILNKGLTEEQIRWRRYKTRSMRSENKGNLFPQEYISDLVTCFIGPKDRVFAEVDGVLAQWALNCREPLRQDGILSIWKEPEPGALYTLWLDPCGGEAIGPSDPHDGVILKIHAGGLEHVASFRSYMEQKPMAEKTSQIGYFYNTAMVVVERNGVGKGVLNYLVNDFMYPNLLPEVDANSEPNGKWGWFTDKFNKPKMISDTIEAMKELRVVSYDLSLVSQLRALVIKDGKIVAKDSRDDRAMAFCGAVCISPRNINMSRLAVGSYVTFGSKMKRRRVI